MTDNNEPPINLGTIFTQALDIRVAYAKAEIFGDECTQFQHEIEAHILGADAYRAGLPDVPGLFQSIPALNRAWDAGVNAAINGGGWSRDTEEGMPLQVLRSAAGYYIGTADGDEPISRESEEYYRSRDAAKQALDLNLWTQRLTCCS